MSGWTRGAGPQNSCIEYIWLQNTPRSVPGHMAWPNTKQQAPPLVLASCYCTLHKQDTPPQIYCKVHFQCTRARIFILSSCGGKRTIEQLAPPRCPEPRHHLQRLAPPSSSQRLYHLCKLDQPMSPGPHPFHLNQEPSFV